MMLDDIAALAALHAKATPRPWAVDESVPATVTIAPGYWFAPGHIPYVDHLDGRVRPEADAALIAAAVNALPALLALARRGLRHDPAALRDTTSPTVRRIVGPTILLAGGTYFDLLDPEGSEFTIADVARGLSNTCRFAGQTHRFYSVAEHAVHVSRIVPPEDAYAGLMHDAAEAFIGDVSKPLKDLLPEYREIERRVEAAVFARFAVPAVMSASVKAADLRMLAAEQRQIMRNQDEWGTTGGHEPAPVEVLGLMPDAAMALFLARYAELRALAGIAP